jgi:hypothetical protein
MEISHKPRKLSALAGVSSVVMGLTGVKNAVVDHFNYGNFLDGTDNPCVSAKLQLERSLTDSKPEMVTTSTMFNHFNTSPTPQLMVSTFTALLSRLKTTNQLELATSLVFIMPLFNSIGKYNASDSAYVGSFIGTSSNSTVNIYTVNYNVLRVMSGIAVTAYSN